MLGGQKGSMYTPFSQVRRWGGSQGRLSHSRRATQTQGQNHTLTPAHTSQATMGVSPCIRHAHTCRTHTPAYTEKCTGHRCMCTGAHSLRCKRELRTEVGPGEPVSSGMTQPRQFPLAGLQCWATCQQHTGQTDTSHCWEAACAAFSSN